jgi:hypothetical protein
MAAASLPPARMARVVVQFPNEMTKADFQAWMIEEGAEQFEDWMFTRYEHVNNLRFRHDDLADYIFVEDHACNLNSATK